MNLKIFEVRNTTTKTARRTALVLLAAAFVSLPLHGQQASGSDSAASAPDLNAADQAITYRKENNRSKPHAKAKKLRAGRGGLT